MSFVQQKLISAIFPCCNFRASKHIHTCVQLLHILSCYTHTLQRILFKYSGTKMKQYTACIQAPPSLKLAEPLLAAITAAGFFWVLFLPALHIKRLKLLTIHLCNKAQVLPESICEHHFQILPWILWFTIYCPSVVTIQKTQHAETLRGLQWWYETTTYSAYMK